ncbi:nitrous oxide reductase family maturation protein NosD [Sedimentisphaera cyanobacteriorum]|uniref:Nitrous oxide reductase family maturation protein NosD n=1 Tax=Sedimentisphaera cyanobacteriorum TaxID=1940790 RepID=A0A1Q2HR58_9BACT|nr:right-handed parallel beta-helix repeat-containing protein [Sedimentisphaera cyanobacteriorum]AQQ09937.1 nitrous oxide reductase family maturation protein NosD [Sedimentisphaera cyanobacteriorum]
MKVKTFFTAAVLLTFALSQARAETYYIDSQEGSDSNSGLSESSPLEGFEKVNSKSFASGDKILIKRGSKINGSLKISANASAENPLVIAPYGKGQEPVIDAAGYLAGVHIKNSSGVVLKGIEITGDAGKPKEKFNQTQRYAVLVEADKGGVHKSIRLEELDIHDIFAAKQRPSDGKNKTSNRAVGILFSSGGNTNSFLSDLTVINCRIRKTGFTGISFSCNNKEEKYYNTGIRVLKNRLQYIGGPGIQPSRAKDMLVQGNKVYRSGSTADKRMHSRGSGIWTWSCSDVLIEKNKFTQAGGKADSCGMHIDFNCRNVVIQYNYSAYNAGGFIEILGNNHNCAYRYNVSVNDGFREKGKKGAHQEGKILWTSGYVGRNREKHGPYNSYIYNNTIYTKPGSRSCFSISPTTQGLLIANNIFCLNGKTVNVLGDQDNQKARSENPFEPVVFKNNIYCSPDILPEDLGIKDSNPIYGSPDFQQPGGWQVQNYIPQNKGLIKDKGIEIPKLPSDETGLEIGLEPPHDFAGKEIKGRPDIGAFEID